MSVRNRELVFLLPALILTTLGFALVYTVKSATLTWSSLTYGLLFLVLFAIAHIGRRVLAPLADPYLLPVTALLSTLGLLLLYRIDEDFALKQAMWLVVGLVAFLLVLVVVRDLRPLARHKYWLGIAGLLAPARHRRRRARRSTAPGCGLTWAPSTSSRPSSARCC